MNRMQTNLNSINMSTQCCIICFGIISYLKLIPAAAIPLRPLRPTSTYKPSTLLLPPGFDSQKAPLQPMLYPYAVSPTSISYRPKQKTIASTTPGWIPVALNVRSDLPLVTPNSYSTTLSMSSYNFPILEDRISNDETKYSSPSYKKGPVFESIVYGTWKPDPPLQPVTTLTLNDRYQQLHTTNSNSNINKAVDVNGKFYNKTINRQHGGFLGHIPQKVIKNDRLVFGLPASISNAPKPKEFAEINAVQKSPIKIKKQGRRKINPISLTTEQNSIERYLNREVATMPTALKANIQHQQNVIKVNSTDPKLMEVVKQINESFEIKYNHKQTSTHSIEMMTTADANNDDDVYTDNDKFSVLSTQWATNSLAFSSTEPQEYYNENIFETLKSNDNNATRRSWPTDFIEEPFTTTDSNYNIINNSAETELSDGIAADASEIPLALSALNIPPSLWPQLPGNITKLGKPYEAESSAEEPAICVPITVREQNMMQPKELIYIERIFCFPMPQSTTSENNFSTIVGSTTLKTVLPAKVENFNDFIDPNSRVSNASTIFKHRFVLRTIILLIYFKFII